MRESERTMNPSASILLESKIVKVPLKGEPQPVMTTD